MTSSILYLAVIALLAARCVSADYWVTCEYTAIKSCLVELNYNQYSSSTAGASALASATNTNVRTISYSGTPTTGGCILYQVSETCDNAKADLALGGFGSRRTSNSCFYPTGYTGSTLCEKLAATGSSATAPTGVTSVSLVTSSASSGQSSTSTTPTSTSRSTPSSTSRPSSNTPVTVSTASGTSTVNTVTGSVPGLVVPSWGRKMHL